MSPTNLITPKHCKDKLPKHKYTFKQFLKTLKLGLLLVFSLLCALGLIILAEIISGGHVTWLEFYLQAYLR